MYEIKNIYFDGRQQKYKLTNQTFRHIFQQLGKQQPYEVEIQG